MTPLRTAQAIAALTPDNAIGHNQTWQDMTASRAAATSYQNTSGKPIQLSIFNVNSVKDFQVSADGSTWNTISEIGGNYERQNSIIIPDGWYYRINGTTTIGGWWELR
jgi:hypothetical protein